MCAELADLGMDLARAAAAKARAEWADPEHPPTEDEPPEPAAEPPSRPAQASPPRAAAIRAPAAKPTDSATIFTRLTATVLACITLEARLAAGLTPTRRDTSPALRADPRRAPLRDIFRRITELHPDRAELVRETTARIDEDLEADPDQTNDLPTIFFTICEAFGIEVDLAILPDSILGLAPDPCATSPP
jgi:hypothetical protein